MSDPVRADPCVRPIVRPSGADRLIDSLRRLLRQPRSPVSTFTGEGPGVGAARAPLSGVRGLDCQHPDAPADLPITHGLQLAAIEGRLAKLESQMANQNRLLLIGILALVGDLAKQVFKP